MRHLVLLALLTLAAFPMSAYDHERGPHREVVAEAPCWPRQSWDKARWEHRGQSWHRDDRSHRDHGWHRSHDRFDRYDNCGEGRVVLGPLPLPPPLRGRVEWRFR